MKYKIFRSYEKYLGVFFSIYSEESSKQIPDRYTFVQDIDLPEFNEEEQNAMAIKAIDAEIDKARAEVDKLVDAKQKLLCITVS